MKSRNILLSAAAITMAVLILDTRCSIEGAKDAISLCMSAVIPSLFPFLVISVLLTQSIYDLPILRPIGRLFRLPTGGEGLLVTGLLGGYPVGAQAVAQAVRNGALPQAEGNRLLYFCSQAGPGFLFGIAGRFFPDARYGWYLWCIQLVSAWCVSLLVPVCTHSPVHSLGTSTISLPAALRRAVNITGEICGWILLFRVLLSFLDRWFFWRFPGELRCLAAGLLELTNGCLDLEHVENIALRFLLCAGMLNFGGLCVMMQTLSVTEGLDFRNYFTGKILQTLVSLLLSLTLFYPQKMLIPWGVFLILAFLKFFQKRVEKSHSLMYNLRNIRKELVCHAVPQENRPGL